MDGGIRDQGDDGGYGVLEDGCAYGCLLYTSIYGLNYAYTNGSPVLTGIPEAFPNLTLIRIFSKIPINVIYMLVIVLILWILLNRTEIGERIKAIGGNITASKLAGINTDRIKIITYCISGACASITGILLASVMGSGTSSAGDAYLMNSFACVLSLIHI